MKKLFKNEKGFTLVELMIVIAIIGILAAVLVPKMSFMKDSAKSAGIDSNMRIAEATISSMIVKYNTTTIGTFATDLATNLDTVTKNPFSGSDAARVWDYNAPAAAIYTYAGKRTAFDSTYANAAGSVICAYYADQGRIKVDLLYIDKTGKPSTQLSPAVYKTVE